MTEHSSCHDNQPMLFLKFTNFFLDYKFFHWIKGKMMLVITKPNLKPAKDKSHRHYYVLSQKPLIICTSEPTSDLQFFSEKIGQRKAYFLVMFWGNLLFNDRKIKNLRENFEIQQMKYPQHKIIFLCNTEEERQILGEFNPDTHFINHNCLLDSDLYNIENVQKDLEVIYNGRLDQSKRHYLLEKCQNVALISAPILKKKSDHLNLLYRKIGQARVMNFSPPIELQLAPLNQMPSLSSKEVRLILNRSKVGVILSASEGACYASMEYLLCGIPVVSTRSLGGRDVFFNHSFAKVVHSNSKAIQAAVAHFLEMDYSPSEVRKEALSQISSHLSRFKNLLKGIMDSEGVSFPFDEIWDKVYINKMLIPANSFIEDFDRQVNAADSFISDLDKKTHTFGY